MCPLLCLSVVQKTGFLSVSICLYELRKEEALISVPFTRADKLRINPPERHYP